MTAAKDPCFMHLDIDAFFPSVEQARLPFLKNRPVVVGSGVIASCSYEARRFGLHAGMAIHEARRLCPDAVYLAGDAQVYKAFSEKVWTLCHTLSPAVDTYLDDAYLDMSGTHRLYPDVRVAAAYLQQRIRKETGLFATLGVGPCRVVARMAGAQVKPRGLCVVAPHEVIDFLTDKPVETLVGVGRKTARTLRMFGITTVGEMRGLPLEGLRELFGKNGETLYARCRGQDGRVMGKSEIPRTISRETTFHCATDDPAEIRSMLYYLTERAVRTARRLGILARSVGLRICYSDWMVRAGQRTLPATDLEHCVFDAVMELLRVHHQRRVSLRRVGVTLSRFAPGTGAQGGLFEQDLLRRRFRVARAVDEVRNRFGFKAVVAGPAVGLLKKLDWGEHGYVLRTPSLTK
ncbi:MAG: DNA polymerase IV [Planctomycetes bacterium]|nr:DNA polymerase IV [Planctomycetota bacterium]